MIGIIDSGLGGLSVLREIRTLLPEHSLHYIADSAWCPYGPRPAGEIRDRIDTLASYLITHGAQVIVIACNSATIHAIEAMRSVHPVPFVGMEPAVKPAAEITQSGVIGLLATEASLEGERLHTLIDTHAAQIRVHTKSCPDFVTLIEQGLTGGPAVDDAIARYALPLVEAGADVLVLGCSHYPFLEPAIRAMVGPDITIIDTGAPVARRVLDVAPPPRGNTRSITLETTGDLNAFQDLVPKLWNDLETDNCFTIQAFSA